MPILGQAIEAYKTLKRRTSSPTTCTTRPNRARRSWCGSAAPSARATKPARSWSRLSHPRRAKLGSGIATVVERGLDGDRRRNVVDAHDVSVMGIDDIPTAIAVHPALTTVAIPLHELGATGWAACSGWRGGVTPTTVRSRATFVVAIRSGRSAAMPGRQRGLRPSPDRPAPEQRWSVGSARREADEAGAHPPKAPCGVDVVRGLVGGLGFPFAKYIPVTRWTFGDDAR